MAVRYYYQSYNIFGDTSYTAGTSVTGVPSGPTVTIKGGKMPQGNCSLWGQEGKDYLAYLETKHRVSIHLCTDYPGYLMGTESTGSKVRVCFPDFGNWNSVTPPKQFSFPVGREMRKVRSVRMGGWDEVFYNAEQRLQIQKLYLTHEGKAYEVGATFQGHIYFNMDLGRMTSGAGERTSFLILKATLDKHLAQVLLEVQAKVEKENEENFKKLFCAAAGREITQIQESIEGATEMIRDYSYRITEQAQKREKFIAQLREKKKITASWEKRLAVKEYQGIRALQGKVVQTVDVHATGVNILTKPITIDFEDYLYSMGSSRINISLGEQLQILFAHENDHTQEGHIHPHVNSNGVACWGNAEETAGILLGRRRLYSLILLALEFLNNYNLDSPYIKLENWNPDWEDVEDKWENCYENSTSRDCVQCGEDICNYYDGEGEACFGNHNGEDCISCNHLQNCEQRQAGYEVCKEQNEGASHCANECRERSRENCPFYQDYSACANESNEDDCVSCETNCEFSHSPSPSRDETAA